MSASTCCLLGRLPANGKFWLKRARIDPSHLPADVGGGTPFFDIRIEEGRIRAVLPAGEAPCCAPGLDLDGGTVAPLHENGRVGPGQPADLTLTMPQGRRVDMQGGQMADGSQRTYDA